MSDKEQEIKEKLHTPLFPIVKSLLNTQSYNTVCLTFVEYTKFNKYNITVVFNAIVFIWNHKRNTKYYRNYIT